MQNNRTRLARLSEEESLDGDPDNFRDFVTFDFVTLSTFVLEGSQSLRGFIRIIYYYNNI